MALAMVFFSTSSAIAEDLDITVGGGSFMSEVSWDIVDPANPSVILASGGAPYTGTVTIPSGCYDMNMYDSYGDGWNGNTYTISDQTTGTVYATGGLVGPCCTTIYGVDNVCWGVTGGCTDPAATNYDPLAAFDDGSCTYANCTDVTLNMIDSYGDGWNGNYFVLTSSAGVVAMNATLASGLSGTATACLPDDCYTISWVNGSFMTEVSWTLTEDATGNVLASGGAPGAGTVCLPAIYGCTDPGASNYDPLANTDDGSCTYPCIAADTSESFEVNTGAWVQDASSAYNWTMDAAGTPSSSTGPSAAFDGVNYMFTESSGNYGATSSLIAGCVDMSGWTDPAMVMAYHMYGAAMGTLDVDVSTDGGATWTNEWTMSGDQGNVWNEAVISLSAYSGQISVKISGTTGTSFTSDMAIDLVRFMEMPSAGCMDPMASNYDPAATIDDGSCIYPGCTDAAATNYNSGANADCAGVAGGQDMSCCTYPQANTLDFCDDFESASLSTNGWVTLAGSEPGCVVQLTTVNAIADTVSLEMTGADGPAGWTQYSTEAQAFANVTHVSSATILMDMSAM